eukprot:TRINITY_DN3312_c0_g1_i1.p1 TRINITY_DN3312_c0_g1~~TRINITY_DN3312_c0_g1_i1.p1  ORF type:complete len:800 (-),score=81.02 TRINITY_DN3312_c0_g1_i1:43-2442(-)
MFWLLLFNLVRFSVQIEPHQELLSLGEEVNPYNPNHEHDHQHQHQHQHQHHDFKHKCIHDEIEQWKREQGIKDVVMNRHPNIIEVIPDPSSPVAQKRYGQQSLAPPYQPIRIYIATDNLDSDPYTCYSAGSTVSALSGRSVVNYRCTAADVLTETKKSYLVDTLLKKSVGWLESALNVVRGTGNLLINTASCSANALEVPVSSLYQSSGVDADFILFVTSRPILGGSTLAFASTCVVDNLGRPLAGQANFNTSNLVGVANDLPRQAGVATHEISHALGFSSGRWTYGTFVQYNGQDSAGNWVINRLPPSSCYTTVPAGTMYDSHDVIITPTVLATASILFGYSVDGAALEDGGGSGTAGSHWEKRIFMNEYMTGSEVNWPILSNLTLSLFKDSGWYTVNFDVADTLVWGRGLGTDFVNQNCGQWLKKFPTRPGFCSSVDSLGTNVQCNYDRRGYGLCNLLDTYTNLPSIYRHYTSATTGGQSMLADYCGYFGQEGLTTWCNIGATNIQQASDYFNFLGTNDYGEQFGLGSRCLSTTLARVNTPITLDSFTNILLPGPPSVRCYNSTCAGPDDFRVQVNGIWYKCPWSSSVSAISYGGKVTCPSQDEHLCDGAKVDNNWPAVTSVYPTSGKPATTVTITGNFLINQFNYTVWMEVECTNVKVVSNSTIVATIPGGDHFVSLADLAIFRTAKNIYVKDSQGRTALLVNSFIIQVPFDAEYLKNLFNWMGANPLWAFIIWLIILLPFFCCCCIIYKCCCKKPKKPRRAANHEYTNEREYYDDDYEVDDYYDQMQKRPAAPKK